MDPQGKFTDRVQDNIDVSSDPKKKVTGWVNVRTYENGVVIKTYYEYGKDAPVREDPPTIDPAIRKVWDEGQGKPRTDVTIDPATGVATKTETPPGGEARVVGTEQPRPTTATSTAPPGGKPYIDDGAEAGTSGRRWGWNPETRAYDRDLGPSPAAQAPTSASESGRKPVTGYPGIFEVSAGTKDKDGNIARDTHYEDAQGNPVDLPAKPPAEPKFSPVYKNNEGQWVQAQTDANGQIIGTRPAPEGSIPADKDTKKAYVQVAQDPTKGTWHGLTAEGQWEEMTGGPGLKPTPPVIVDPSKPQAQLVDDPNNPGQKIAAPVAGTGGNAPADVGALKAELGNVMPELEQRKNQYLEQHKANPTGFTLADVEKALESDRQMAQIRVNEVVGILNAQQNVRSSDITQRQNTLNETQSRRTFADNTATSAFDIIKGLGPALGKQPPGAIDRIIDYVEQKKTGMAQRLGGLDLSPEIGHTPMQDAVNQIPGTGVAPGTGATSTGATSTPAVGGGVTINIGAGAQTQAQQLAGLTDQVTATTNQMAAPRQPSAADFAMLDPSQFVNQTMPQNVDELIALHKKPNDPQWNDAVERAAQGIRNRNRDATPAGAGHQVSGGQLRAPGYSASNGPVGQVGG